MKFRFSMLIFLLFLTISAFAMSFEQLLQRACTVPDSSQLYFRQAARQIKTNKDKASFELYKAIYAGSMGTPDSAIVHAKKALVLYKNEKDTAKIMFTCNTLGKAYQKKGTYEHAIKVLLDGLRMAQHKNEKLWQGYFLVNIALNFHDFGDYKRGVKYASDAFRVFQTESASKPMDKVLALNTIAINYDDGNQPDSALKYHFRIIQLMKKVDTLSIPFTYNNIGNTYLKINKYAEARSWILRATRIANWNKASMSKVDFAYEKATHFTNLTSASFHLNEINAAFRYLDSAKYYVPLSASVEKRRDLYQIQYQLYRHVGNELLAMNFLEKYHALKDSIFEEDRSKTIQELDTKYKVEAKEKELVMTKSYQLAAEQRVQEREMLLTGFILLAVFLLIIIFLIFRQNKLKLEQQEQEFILREEILSVENRNHLQEQRLHIARELHDNIGSQLTYLISSVKNMLYSSKIENKSLRDELLYIEKHAGVTLNELRDTIWATNTESFSFDEMKLRLLTYVEKGKAWSEGIKLEFTIDELCKNLKMNSIAAINLYRIMQEAVTNTCKYADATCICIDIHSDKKQLFLMISDNGNGFDTNDFSPGNGLNNMQKRAEILHADFHLTSSAELGTVIKVIADLQYLKTEEL